MVEEQPGGVKAILNRIKEQYSESSHVQFPDGSVPKGKVNINRKPKEGVSSPRSEQTRAEQVPVKLQNLRNALTTGTSTKHPNMTVKAQDRVFSGAGDPIQKTNDENLKSTTEARASELINHGNFQGINDFRGGDSIKNISEKPQRIGPTETRGNRMVPLGKFQGRTELSSGEPMKKNSDENLNPTSENILPAAKAKAEFQDGLYVQHVQAKLSEVFAKPPYSHPKAPSGSSRGESPRTDRTGESVKSEQQRRPVDVWDSICLCGART